jgi:thymidylate synthase ThyX
MNISAKIIADSISEMGNRITTLQVTLPKVLLAETNTARVFSRNYSSSRAIPVNKVIQLDTFKPLYYGKNKKGMQSQLEEIEEKELAENIWNDAIEYCKKASLRLSELGLHKQWANRLNDWFVMSTGIISATEFDNFFNLRIHPDAQPEMCLLATKMRDAINNSTPIKLNNDQWHLPYIKDDDYELINQYPDIKFILQKISAARCCRVSYLLHDGTNPNVTDDLALFNRLAGSVPKHYSPLEHQAKPDLFDGYVYQYPEYHGNFDGFIQFRKLSEYNLV